MKYLQKIANVHLSKNSPRRGGSMNRKQGKKNHGEGEGCTET